MKMANKYGVLEYNDMEISHKSTLLLISSRMYTGGFFLKVST